MARTSPSFTMTAPRVNLLPPSEIARRERENLGRRWIWVVVGAVVVATLLIAGAWVWNQFAQQRLAAERARTATLVQEVAGLADVSGALAADKDLRAYLAEAMGSDAGWDDIRTRLESALPDGVTVTGFDLTPGPPAARTPPEGEAATAIGLRGTVTLDSPNTLAIDAVARNLRRVEGVMLSDANALVQSSVKQGRYTYTIDITFDQSVYSGRFAEEGEK